MDLSQAEAVADLIAAQSRSSHDIALKQLRGGFSSELKELRERLARSYLTNTAHSSAEIAFMLGYEDPNSFFRAFHDWTGTTPEAVRQAA